MPEQSLDRLIDLIRPQIRNEQPYRVSGDRDARNKLNQNECPFDLPEGLKKELAEMICEIPFNRYPTEHPHQLTEALAELHGIEPECIVVGNGSNELTQTLGLCFITEQSRIVTPRPMFALYESVVRMHGGKIIPVSPRPDLHFDVDGILESIRREMPTLTILASPNNPTGLAMSFEAIDDICSEASGFVLVDEAYQDFNKNPSAISLMSKHPNVLVMRTLSKGIGLAGLRLGYLLGRPEVIREMMKARMPFMVDRISETVALAILSRPDLIRARLDGIMKGIRDLESEMQSIDGISIIPSATNFLLFRSQMDADELASRLADRQVLVRNMRGYPELQGFLRVTTGTEAENKAFIEALKFALERAH
ncbi:MAG: histidinol-phosphate transaminase [Bacteroidetes bacterium]|nr:histidinol-phosphate transaminase [Bacteroidota bacterium]